MLGKNPFKVDDYKESMKNNYKGYIHVDRIINPDTQDFLEKILDKEPSERLSSLDALEHHVFL